MNLIYRKDFLIIIILQQSKATTKHLLDTIICFEHIQILTQQLDR